MAKVNLTKLAKESGIPYGMLQSRVYRGWAIKEASTIPEAKSAASTTPQQNNTSGVRGVTWDKRTESWAAQFQYENKTIFCGRHDSIMEAKEALIKRKKELGVIT